MSKLREIRKRSGLILDDVAERLGVHKTTVSRWETSGKVPLDKVDELASVLGIDAAELISRDYSIAPAPEPTPAPSPGYVRTPEDTYRWWSEVCMAEQDPKVRLVMAVLATKTFMDRDTGIVVFTETDLIERAHLTPETVKYALPKIMQSAYVEKVGSANYAIKLKFAENDG